MKYARLGKSTLEVSKIAFGCMSLGENKQENKRLLLEAYNNGINFFDTADLYSKGENEISVGQAFHAIRDKVIIATKVGNQWRPDSSGWDWNPTKGYILKAVEKSLTRLNTDYIDLYQLHGGTIDDPVDETIEAFEILKSQGKIKTYGISSIRPNVIREYVNRSSIATVMMQYSLLDRRPEEGCLGLLADNEISVLARGSLAQGLMINKSATDYLGHTSEEVKQVQKAIKLFPNRTPFEIAVQFSLSYPAVASVVVGIRNDVQLKEALKSAEGSLLTVAEHKQLTTLIPVRKYDQHR